MGCSQYCEWFLLATIVLFLQEVHFLFLKKDAVAGKHVSR